MKQFEVFLLFIAKQTISSPNQNGLVDNKLKILSLKSHYGVLWEWQYETSHVPISRYLLGSSGGLPVPRDTLVSIREIPSPLQLCAAAIMSSNVWQGCLALKGNKTASCFLTKRKGSGKDRCRGTLIATGMTRSFQLRSLELEDYTCWFHWGVNLQANTDPAKPGPSTSLWK